MKLVRQVERERGAEEEARGTRKLIMRGGRTERSRWVQDDRKQRKQKQPKREEVAKNPKQEEPSQLAEREEIEKSQKKKDQGQERMEETSCQVKKKMIPTMQRQL